MSKMRLMRFYIVLIFVSLHGTLGFSIHSDTLAERHAIVKRLAKVDQKFTEHDVAVVLHEKEHNSFHRISKRDLKSVTDDNTIKHVHLDLSSGSRIHLKLQKRSVFHPDTLFVDNTHEGLVLRKTPPEDCYATGEIETDGMVGGFASLAMCNGLHGTAISDGMEYYIHPVEHIDGDHHVHVLSRRASDNKTFPEVVAFDGISSHEETVHRYKRSSTVTQDTYKNATSIVIEMALFIDARYWENLQNIAPGREDEFVLIAMAATNALYSNKEKVGYDASIKIKLYQKWIVDPDEYKFEESIFSNLKTFCTYTREKYEYDMHFLFTGVTRQVGPAIGVAYMASICTKLRCGNIYSMNMDRMYTTIAHEIGHNLGFNHHFAAKCPEEIKNLGKGFMGSGRDLSPCNKWELHDFFSKGKGQCLFEETREVRTSEEFLNLPKLFSGQYHNPDEGCKLLAGEDYELFRPFDFRGNGECAARMCINSNKESPEYLRVRRKYALAGYTCGDEMFCDGITCSSWDKPGIGWSVSHLRENKGENHWSEWSDEWTPCSKTCGKGVQLKRRRCIFSSGPFLSPFCRGSSVQVRLCNKDPCPGNAMSVSDQRQISGDTVCERFYKNNVTLQVSKGSVYLPQSKNIWIKDKANQYLETKSCLLMCTRSPSGYNYVDSFYPDGTPCTDSKKSPHKRERFNIDLMCVQGACLEMSDCPGNEEKDECGVCGGDLVHCVNKALNRSDDVANGERKVIATLPAGTRSIDINMVWWNNKQVRLELWTAEGEKIIGKGGLFGKNHYRGTAFVPFANTTWKYDHGGYLQSDGPTDQDLVVKVLRQSYPINSIDITYLLPQTDGDSNNT